MILSDMVLSIIFFAIVSNWRSRIVDFTTVSRRVFFNMLTIFIIVKFWILDCIYDFHCTTTWEPSFTSRWNVLWILWMTARGGVNYCTIEPIPVQRNLGLATWTWFFDAPKEDCTKLTNFFQRVTITRLSFFNGMRLSSENGGRRNTQIPLVIGHQDPL